MTFGVRSNHLSNAFKLCFPTLLLLLAAGCGGTKSATTIAPACVASSTPEFAYILTGYAVSMFTVDSCNGVLDPTPPVIMPTGISQPQIGAEAMAVDPFGRFAYVANLVSNSTDQATISMYTINSGTGLLTPTTPPMVATGFFPQGIAVDPFGKFVYTANSDDNTVSMFTIDPSTGVLTPTTPPTVAAGWSPGFVTIDPSGRFAYVSNQDDNTISMYTINSSTGILMPMTPATVPADSPFGVTVDPSGKFAYVPDAYSAGNWVSEYTIDPVSGVLAPTGVVTAGNEPAAVAVDPSSKFAYVTNRVDNTVSMFTINPTTGALSPNGTAATGDEPYTMAFDPSGKFLYVGNQASYAMVYTLNRDGTLASGGQVGTGGVSIAVTAAK